MRTGPAACAQVGVVKHKPCTRNAPIGSLGA